MNYLIVTRGPQAGTRFRLQKFPAIIGRDPGNTVCLTDSETSPFHVRIKRRGQLLILEDLDPKNGCHLNGNRVINSIIQNGDHILIGSTELKLIRPSDTVDVASEVSNFNMAMDKELGISGPIDIPDKNQGSAIKPLAQNHTSILNKFADHIKNIRKIYDLQGHIMVMNNPEDASHSLIKGIYQLAPDVSRCAVFIWSPENHQLIPTASKHFEKIHRPFRINTKALSDALGVRQGMQIKDETIPGAPSGYRIILPMVNINEVLCLVHLEFDKPAKKIPTRILENVQTLLTRCAPSFETLLLRSEISSFMFGMVETIVATIEAKDTYTAGHSERVCRFSMGIADELRLNKEVKKMLMISSLCHDIGKIGIPDAILKKAALLSSEEYEEMKLHPTIGANIISHMPNAKKFLSGVKYHHEKWDGTGYPEGLTGENIPFFGRIIAVADVLDAMISGRAYSGFIDESEAIEKIQNEADLFDPEIIKALVRAWENGIITQRTSTHSDINPARPDELNGLKK